MAPHPSSPTFPRLLHIPDSPIGVESVRRSYFPSKRETPLAATASLQIYTGDQFGCGAPHPQLRALPLFWADLDTLVRARFSLSNAKGKGVESFLQYQQWKYVDVEPELEQIFKDKGITADLCNCFKG